MLLAASTGGGEQELRISSLFRAKSLCPRCPIILVIIFNFGNGELTDGGWRTETSAVGANLKPELFWARSVQLTHNLRRHRLTLLS
jgi:hypothetical protein